MGREEPHEVQSKDVEFCTLGVITPGVSAITTCVCAGDVLKKLCRKRPGGPGEHQGECEPAVFPRGIGICIRKCHKQIEGGDAFPLPSLGETPPAVLCLVLGSPVQRRYGDTGGSLKVL